MSNLTTNAALNLIAEALTGGDLSVDGNTAVNIIADAVASIANAGRVVQRDEFVALGMLASASAASGAASYAGNARILKRNSVSDYAVMTGVGTATLANITGSRIAWRTANPSVRFYTSVDGSADLSIEMSIYDGSNVSIDFTQDPVFGCWGFLTGFDLYPTTASGTYFRNPYASETQFIKYCMMQNGVETVLSTTVPFDGNIRATVYSISWDSVANTMTYTVQDATTTYTYTVSNFSTTYPTVYGSALRFGFGLFRNGTGTTMLGRQLISDYFQLTTKTQF